MALKRSRRSPQGAAPERRRATADVVHGRPVAIDASEAPTACRRRHGQLSPPASVQCTRRLDPFRCRRLPRQSSRAEHARACHSSGAPRLRHDAHRPGHDDLEIPSRDADRRHRRLGLMVRSLTSWRRRVADDTRRETAARHRTRRRGSRCHEFADTTIPPCAARARGLAHRRAPR